MRCYFWMVAVGILTCSVCFGQSVSIGVVAGGMVSNDLGDPWLTHVSTRYAVGPELNIGLPLGFGIEVDALYRNEGYHQSFNPGYTGSSELYATSREFPFLLKKSLAFPEVKPFVVAGYAPRKPQGTTYTGATTSQGFLIGGGVQFGIGRMRLLPEVRYTRWNNNPVLLVIPNGPSPYLSANKVDALLGVSWKVR